MPNIPERLGYVSLIKLRIQKIFYNGNKEIVFPFELYEKMIGLTNNKLTDEWQ